MITESAIESAMEAETTAEAVTPMPARTDFVQWQSKLIELLAKLENLRLQLAGTSLATDSDFILERSETMVQLTEELANATTFSDRSTEPQMAALAKAGTFYSALNDARRGVSRSLLYTMMNAFTADGTRDQAKEVRNCLALTIETLHSYFSLFTQNYPSSLIARGWVDVASAFLADFRQMIKDNSQK